MAAPLALLLGVLGGLVGYALQHRPRGREHAPAMLPDKPSRQGSKFNADPGNLRKAVEGKNVS